jgi:hypothetical protein
MRIVCPCGYDTHFHQILEECIQELQRIGGYFCDESDNRCPQCAESRMEIVIDN